MKHSSLTRSRLGAYALGMGATLGGALVLAAGGASAAAPHGGGARGRLDVHRHAAVRHRAPRTASTDTHGAAFAMTNSTAGNRVVEYYRAPDGKLTRTGSVSTRGLGIGVDLDTQGALQLSADHKYLYAANAGSNDVSVFAVNGTHLTLEQKIYAGGEPNSITIHDNLVYVLDGSVAENTIRGFRANQSGKLTPIAGSLQSLSSPIGVPGDIEFSPNGSLLLVTEKVTDLTLSPQSALDAFPVNAQGVAGPALRDQSVGLRPFALAFLNNSQILVGESFNAHAGMAAVSSYNITGSDALEPISANVPNNQTDTCWIVITSDKRFAYTANFGTNSISSYSIASNGAITLQQGQAAALGAGAEPVDLAQTADSHYLYNLLRGTGAVAEFRIGSDGNLTSLGTATGGLPVNTGASGLAVY